MAATVRGFGETKNILIHVKFERFNEHNMYIKQSTSNWTSVQHKRGFTKLLKVTDQGFYNATVRNEGRLQA